MAVNMQLTTDEARDMDALVYLRHVDQWQKQIHLKSGRRVYGLPSRTRPGLFHLTDGSDCSCEDRVRNSTRCAHMRAAILYRMERQGQIIADSKMAERGLRKARPTAEALWGMTCGVVGCTDDQEDGESYCRQHQLGEF